MVPGYHNLNKEQYLSDWTDDTSNTSSGPSPDEVVIHRTRKVTEEELLRIEVNRLTVENSRLKDRLVCYEKGERIQIKISGNINARLTEKIRVMEIEHQERVAKLQKDVKRLVEKIENKGFSLVEMPGRSILIRRKS